MARSILPGANTKTPTGNEQTRPLSCFPKASHYHRTPFAVFTMHAVASLLFISLIYASQRKHTSMLGRSTHLQVIPQQTCGYRHNTARASSFALAIIFKIQVPLQKFPFLVRYTVPCLYMRKRKLPSFHFCLVYNSWFKDYVHTRRLDNNYNNAVKGSYSFCYILLSINC